MPSCPGYQTDKVNNWNGQVSHLPYITHSRVWSMNKELGFEFTLTPFQLIGPYLFSFIEYKALLGIIISLAVISPCL